VVLPSISIYLFGVRTIDATTTPFPSSSSSGTIFVHERYYNNTLYLASIHCFFIIIIIYLYVCVCVCVREYSLSVIVLFSSALCYGVNAHRIVAEEKPRAHGGSFPTSHLTDACVPVVIYHDCKAPKRMVCFSNAPRKIPEHITSYRV